MHHGCYIHWFLLDLDSCIPAPLIGDDFTLPSPPHRSHGIGTTIGSSELMRTSCNTKGHLGGSKRCAGRNQEPTDTDAISRVQLGSSLFSERILTPVSGLVGISQPSNPSDNPARPFASAKDVGGLLSCET